MLDQVAQDPRRAVSESIGWDVGTWSRALPWWTCHTRLDGPVRALEVGAGGRNAGLSLWLALQGHEVVCSGLEPPSEQMRASHAAWGVASRISYASADVLALDAVEEYDLVVFKSVLGRVGGNDRFDLQREAVRRMHRALRPGGELWFAENAVGGAVHQAARRRVGAGRWAWRYVAAAELPVLLEPFAATACTSFGVTAAAGRTERQRRVLATLDGALLERLVPPSWHYVVAGVAHRD